ncbi:hypothetical protein ABPG74_002859 [Tetrahymena malaccensis]
MHRYFRIVQELAEKEIVMNNKSRFQAYVSAYNQAKDLRVHHSQIIKKYNLGYIDSLASQYHQNIILRKNNKLMQEYQEIVKRRVLNRKIEGTTDEIKHFTEDLKSYQSNLFALSEKSFQDFVDQQMLKLKDKNQLKKYLDPKELILLYQYYHSKINEIMLGYVKLYHEAVQNMLEGKREVMQKEDFKFEDGETVKHKMDKLEEYLKSKMPKFRSNKNIK